MGWLKQNEQHVHHRLTCGSLAEETRLLAFRGHLAGLRVTQAGVEVGVAFVAAQLVATVELQLACLARERTCQLYLALLALIRLALTGRIFGAGQGSDLRSGTEQDQPLGRLIIVTNGSGCR